MNRSYFEPKRHNGDVSESFDITSTRKFMAGLSTVVFSVAAGLSWAVNEQVGSAASEDLQLATERMEVDIARLDLETAALRADTSATSLRMDNQAKLFNESVTQIEQNLAVLVAVLKQAYPNLRIDQR